MNGSIENATETQTQYGIHPAHDAAVAAHKLRHAVRELSDADESTPVGLGLAANLADVLADALDRYWWTIRPSVLP